MNTKYRIYLFVGGLSLLAALLMVNTTGATAGATTSNLPVSKTSSGSGIVVINKTSSGSGIVVSSPAGINCGNVCTTAFIYGTPIQLFAIPQSGFYQFISWGGDIISTDNPVFFIVNGDKQITANFTLLGLQKIYLPQVHR